jgi:hypothetical protein
MTDSSPIRVSVEIATQGDMTKVTAFIKYGYCVYPLGRLGDDELDGVARDVAAMAVAGLRETIDAAGGQLEMSRYRVRSIFDDPNLF